MGCLPDKQELEMLAGNRNHTTIAAAIGVALALVLPAVARAQSSTWELGLTGGLLRHDFLFEDNDKDPVVGARLARYSAGGWGFALAGDFVPAGDVVNPLEEGGDFEAQIFRYSAGLDKSFGVGSRTRLNVGAGAGALTARYNDIPTATGTTDRSETHLLIPVGAGLKILNRAVDPSWGLRFDARDNIVFLDDTDVLGQTRSDDIAHMPDFSAGLSFFFGGGKKARVVERPAPAPARTEPARAREEEDRGSSEALATIQERIFFDFDRFDLRPEARETLQRKAGTLRAYPDVRILIEGHADERGTVEYNLALGERRANTARAYLIDLGIDPDRMTTISYGEERPLVDGHNEAAWSQNRRDEFVPRSW